MSHTIHYLSVWNKPLFDTYQYCSTSRANQSLRSGFQNRGVCLQAFPSFPSPLFHFLALGLSLLRNQAKWKRLPRRLTFCKILLLEFVSKRLWIEMTGFHTPIYFINESIILKNESFCVVCIITYVTVVLLFKDGSNTLHVILTCILLFTLFRWCSISIIVLTRWIGWLKQQ